MRDYIPVKKHWFEMYERFNTYFKLDNICFTAQLKVPIEKVKIDKSLFAYQNEVSQSDVLYMLVNFDREAWMPIRLNKDYYLLDGQHRLAVARRMGLSFIDVIIECSTLLKNTNKKESCESKRRSKAMIKLEAEAKKLKTELKMLERKLGLGDKYSYD